MPKSGLVFKLRGYIKPEGKHFVAVCVDLNLAGQGDTPEIAMSSMLEAIETYLDYLTEHPDEISKRLPRKAPLSFRLTYYLASLISNISIFINIFKNYRPFTKNIIPGQLRIV